MSKDYVLMTVEWAQPGKQIHIALNRMDGDLYILPSIYHVFRYAGDDEAQPHHPYRSLKISKEQAQEFCNDLMSLFDDRK